jgi:ribonuclease P protein component
LTLSSPATFPSHLRLNRAADFEAVFASARRSADPLFTVLFRPSSQDHARIGMTASAKRIRTAVGRNRIRRLVRESFRRVQTELAGLDIVVVIKEPAARADNASIAGSLEAHWRRLRRVSSAG